ncbi:MAG: cbb3-type cytochrome c oxidase subunit I [Zetaproteobacteria bacterium]|nr:cbb3-type cytochrome c oxidase subunit I [Zetaproteobacteria bacterium]
MNAAIFNFATLSGLLTMIGILVTALAFYSQAWKLTQTSGLSIFAQGEVGQGESAAVTSQKAHWRSLDILSQASVSFGVLTSSFWLVIGSLAGFTSSIKLHHPEVFGNTAELTFGRLRSFHLNAVGYGWLSIAGVSLVVWLMPRLVRERLPFASFNFAGIGLWNLCLTAGLTGILLGHSSGIEWLEMPRLANFGIALAGGMVATPVLLSVLTAKVDHLYVTAWYFLAALLWFPILFIIGNAPSIHNGIEHALANWWFAHNALGLWFTPISIGIGYYIIPKIIGRPIYSYNLSFLGFWTLALFYSNVGVHHLIGGPVPQWVVTVSVVMSMMMLIPVIAVAINHHMTAFRFLSKLRTSIPLRFIVIGSMMYTVSSVQGSLHSLRGLSRISHFTHYTVGHAHLGAYGFVSFVLFGAIYFALPKVMERDWPYPKWISLHFWCAIIGILVYVISLSIGGIIQGMAMLDISQPFMNSVTHTQAYMIGRSVGGGLMTLGHLVFFAHIVGLMLGALSNIRHRGELQK